MPSKPDDASASPTTGRALTFRLFVSSTFQDLRAERNALHAHVFPRLRELCQGHGCRFQAIDLRWGVSGEAARDQQTMIICLREIERCHRVTPRPNFLVLLGDRYGWRPPPPRIPADEFDALLQHVSAEEAELLRWSEEQPAEGKGWYRPFARRSAPGSGRHQSRPVSPASPRLRQPLRGSWCSPGSQVRRVSRCRNRVLISAVIGWTGSRRASYSHDRGAPVLLVGATATLVAPAVLHIVGCLLLIHSAGGLLPFVSYGPVAAIVDWASLGAPAALAPRAVRPAG